MVRNPWLRSRAASSRPAHLVKNLKNRIAAAIVAAFNNVYPMFMRRAWVVAFAFDFIHGLGFASALR